MLTDEQKYVLSILRRSLGVITPLLTPDTLATIPNIIIRNGILLTVYPLIKSEGKDAELLETALRKHYFAAVKQAVVQDYEGEQVLELLSGSGLDCIALKGWELRKYYPEPTMRQMADLDILVRPYEYEKIKSVMEGLEYTGDRESSWKHDSFVKNEVNVEMHKRLTDDSGVIQRWEKQMWERAVCVGNHLYKMSDEDYYIFHFIHLHKDFMNGSLGLRRIADTWLLNRHDGLDMEFVESELSSMGLSRFHNKMVKLGRVCMAEDEMDEDSEILLTHAFAHGIYGTDKSYKASRIASMSRDGSMKAGKIQSSIAAVFLPYSKMKAQFPVLERWPVLLPYCWIKRIIRFLRGNMQKNKQMMDYSSINEADYAEMKRFFKAGGV